MRPLYLFLPSILRRHLRRPSTYALCGALLSLTTGAVTYRLLDGAADGAARYGDPIRVAVARRAIVAGSTIEAGDVEMRDLPSRAVPPSALRSRSIGRAVRHNVATGRVLIDDDLGTAGTSGTAAALPAGTVALAVPTPTGSLRLSTGDHVDLIEIPTDGDVPEVAGTEDDTATSGTALAGSPVAGILTRDAVVVAVDDDSITVGVDDLDAARVAAAVVHGSVVPVLRGSP